MKEMVSFHDDAEKRLGIFFGLGAFLLSSLFSLFQGMPPEAFLLRGVVVLILFSLMGWIFGLWLKNTLEATKPHEELPSNMERRSRNAENLDEGAVVMPNFDETVVMEEPNASAAGSGQVVNFTLPELSPMDMPLQGAPAKRAAAPMIPAAAAPAPAMEVVADGDLPPPAVPSWLK
jgi:hypothetical protein